MIRQTTLLVLCLGASLGSAGALAAEPAGGCAAKRQVLEEKIAAATQHGNTNQLDGLRRALGNIEAQCDDDTLHRERLATVEEAKQEVQEREMDLREAMGKGDPDKIAKRQAKLAEARAELEQAEAEARADQ